MKTKKIAVILAGCGVYDGSEIHEATLTLLAISKLGATYELFAPDIDQYDVINHLTGQPMNEKRNVLVEAARIARGKIKPLNYYKASEFDALIIPGGYGAAKNLSTFAIDNENMKVNEQVERAIIDTAKLGKPIGAWCISPVILAKVLGKINITLGQNNNVVDVITKFGANHVTTNPTEIAIDKTNKIVTTPCYMLESTIAQVYDGIENAVREILKLTLTLS
ncbi:MAG: isoprenoid biosynthesis glyoxalase ElbB [Bacteroidales bacterium]|nr:isoprenoid biosynthesis glyoxalase ElbB [Bacteroidales bacterium]